MKLFLSISEAYLFIFASKNGLYPDWSLPWPESFSSLAQTAISKHPRNTNNRNIPEIKLNIFSFEVEQTGYPEQNRNACLENWRVNHSYFAPKYLAGAARITRGETLGPRDKTQFICQKSSKYIIIIYIKIFVEN